MNAHAMHYLEAFVAASALVVIGSLVEYATRDHSPTQSVIRLEDDPNGQHLDQDGSLVSNYHTCPRPPLQPGYKPFPVTFNLTGTWVTQTDDPTQICIRDYRGTDGLYISLRQDVPSYWKWQSPQTIHNDVLACPMALAFVSHLGEPAQGGELSLWAGQVNCDGTLEMRCDYISDDPTSKHASRRTEHKTLFWIGATEGCTQNYRLKRWLWWPC